MIKISNPDHNLDINCLFHEAMIGQILDKIEEIFIQEIVNVAYNFVEYLNNEEVYTFYRNNRVDVFLNVSESEGVPVSIMEAMSCHIPTIAPDVGGM